MLVVGWLLLCTLLFTAASDGNNQNTTFDEDALSNKPSLYIPTKDRVMSDIDLIYAHQPTYSTAQLHYLLQVDFQNQQNVSFLPRTTYFVIDILAAPLSLRQLYQARCKDQNIWKWLFFPIVSNNPTLAIEQEDTSWQCFRSDLEGNRIIADEDDSVVEASPLGESKPEPVMYTSDPSQAATYKIVIAPNCRAELALPMAFLYSICPIYSTHQQNYAFYYQPPTWSTSYHDDITKRSRLFDDEVDIKDAFYPIVLLEYMFNTVMVFPPSIASFLPSALLGIITRGSEYDALVFLYNTNTTKHVLPLDHDLIRISQHVKFQFALSCIHFQRQIAEDITTVNISVSLLFDPKEQALLTEEQRHLVQQHLRVYVENIDLSYVHRPGKLTFASSPSKASQAKSSSSQPANDTAAQFMSIASSIPFPSLDNVNVEVNKSVDGTLEVKKVRQECRLLGSSCAVILRNIVFQPLFNPIQREAYLADNPHHAKHFPPLPRIFCGIFTSHKNHDKVRMVKETWGHKCTAFLAFSDKDDLTIPAIDLPHIGEESYANMWQKTRSIWKYIYHNYFYSSLKANYDEANQVGYDYYLLGGDDMFYIMENLYEFLQYQTSIKTAEDFPGAYFGRPLMAPYAKTKFNESVIFNSGGPGYILDRIALRRMIVHFDEDYCSPFVRIYSEDLMIAACLRMMNTSHPIIPKTTLDTDGREIFHIFTAGTSYQATDSTSWVRGFDANYALGKECCSIQSLSFHGFSKEWMHATYDFLYKCSVEEKESYYQEYGEEFYYFNMTHPRIPPPYGK